MTIVVSKTSIVVHKRVIVVSKIAMDVRKWVIVVLKNFRLFKSKKKFAYGCFF